MTDFDNLFREAPENVREEYAARQKAMEVAEGDNSPERRAKMVKEVLRITEAYETLQNRPQPTVRVEVKNKKLLSSQEANEILELSRVTTRPNLPTKKGNQ